MSKEVTPHPKSFDSQAHTPTVTIEAQSPGPRTSLSSNFVASSNANRATWTAGNVGDTENSAGALLPNDNFGRLFWFIHSLIVFADSAMRAVRPSRVRYLVGCMLLGRSITEFSKVVYS